MKRVLHIHKVLMLVALFLCIGTLTVTSAATVDNKDGKSEKTTTVSKNTKKKAAKKKGKLVTKNGYTYYKVNGKYVKKRFVKIKGKTYHFGKDGTMTLGHNR